MKNIKIDIEINHLNNIINVMIKTSCINEIELLVNIAVDTVKNIYVMQKERIYELLERQEVSDGV